MTGEGVRRLSAPMRRKSAAEFCSYAGWTGLCCGRPRPPIDDFAIVYSLCLFYLRA